MHGKQLRAFGCISFPEYIDEPLDRSIEIPSEPGTLLRSDHEIVLSGLAFVWKQPVVVPIVPFVLAALSIVKRSQKSPVMFGHQTSAEHSELDEVEMLIT